MNKSRMNKTPSHNTIKEERNMDHTILLLDHEREYDTIVELRDTALYYGKLISYYGFDMKSGKWNIKRFPITMNGREIEAIISDTAKFNEAVNQYNRYAENLLRKYRLNS